MSPVSTRSRGWWDARGQASVEVVASAGFLLLAGLIGLQLLGFGYAVVMADNAAEAAALALAFATLVATPRLMATSGGTLAWILLLAAAGGSIFYVWNESRRYRV